MKGLGKKAYRLLYDKNEIKRKEDRKENRFEESIPFEVKFRYPHSREKVRVQALSFTSALMRGIQARKSTLDTTNAEITKL